MAVCLKDNNCNAFVKTVVCYLKDQLVIMNNFTFSIDATKETSYGRLVNDSPSNYANAVMKRICLDGIVHLCLYAIQDIDKDFEIR